MKELKIDIWNEKNKVFMQALDQDESVREKEYIYKANERWVEIYQRPNRRIKSKIKNLEGYKINDKRGVLIFSTTRAAEEYVKEVKEAVAEYNESIKEILYEEEKEYLRGVIKPFRDKVEYIRKVICYFNRKEYIEIKVDEEYTQLPSFKAGTMYKGMEIDREYTLKELGL